MLKLVASQRVMCLKFAFRAEIVVVDTVDIKCAIVNFHLHATLAIRACYVSFRLHSERSGQHFLVVLMLLLINYLCDQLRRYLCIALVLRTDW